LFVSGREGDQWWKPYLEARQAVELYKDEPQEISSELDWIAWDEKSKLLEVGLFKPRLPSRCQRFFDRRCPLLESMGHEPPQPTCNYWSYPRFEALTPRLELYPEWQRFDCNKYYKIFQNHLVTAELATRLEAKKWNLVVVGETEKHRKLVEVYASLTSDPESFKWIQG